MQSPPPETYTYPQRVPESTNDVNLKRARVVDSDGKSYIRVLPADGSGLDAQGVADAMGMRASSSTTGSVVDLLDDIDNSTGRTDYAIGTRSDTAWDGQTTNATIIALLKGIYNKL